MNRPKLILLCGLPGSGKTTYALQHYSDCIILSSDAIRKELYGDENIQGSPSEVFSIMQKRAIEALNNGKHVIYDATNMTRRDRAGIINACPKFAYIECHIIWAPIGTCIARDAARGRTVGKAVIDKMLKRFQAPYYDEGIDYIKIVFPYSFDDLAYTENIFDSMKIPHENPHHQLDIYNHCLEAQLYIDAHTNYSYISMAALLHDCGKPYVKAFIDSHGEPSDVAHYYQHQCVSAYIAYGITHDVDVSWLISTHMDPFLNTKYYNKLPAILKNDIDLLHEADLAAH